MYDFDHPQRGVQDCPRCRHTMTRLREEVAIERNEGYLLDDGTDRNWLTFLLWGWEGLLVKFLFRNVMQPLASLSAGNRRRCRYERILRDYPESLFCPHCRHILRRKA